MNTLFGLIGNKLSHSFSKEYFTKKFNDLQLTQYSYELWEIPNLNNIRQFISNKKNVLGFNVTIPYKEEILNYLDIISDEAKEIKACNCVKIKDNKWIGYNTDWWAFLKMIEDKLEPHHTAALILGTGGAAKAVAYALKKLKIPFLYVSRKKSTNKNHITYDELTETYFKTYPIIINTTPLGMYPIINQYPPIPIHFINKKNFIIDIIYNPSTTLLLKEASKRGAKTLNGLEMLYLQAEKSWYIWQDYK